MPDVSKVTDQYEIDLGVTDNMTAPTNAAAQALANLEANAQAAAAAVAAASAGVGGAGEKIAAASSQWSRLAAQNDSVTQATNRLATAQAVFARAQDQATTALNAGKTTGDVAERTLSALADRVSMAATRLLDLKAAQEAAAASGTEWNTALGQVGQNLDTLRDKATAFALVAQQAFNRQLGVTGTATPAEDYAKRAADIAAYGRALDAERAHFDPAFASAAAYNAELIRLNEAHRKGAFEDTPQFQAALDRLNQSFAGVAGPLKNATQAVHENGLTTGETTFIYRTFAREGLATFSALATGAPLLSVVTQEVVRLGTEMTLSRHGFAIFREQFGGILAAIGGWPTVAVAGIVAGLAAIGYVAESNADKIAKMAAQLSASRDDFTAAAAAADKAARDVSAATSASTTDARAAALAIAAIPGVSTDQFAALTAQAVGLAAALGTGIPDAAKKIQAALLDPIKGLNDLANTAVPLKALDATTLGLGLSMAQAGDRAGVLKLLLGVIASTSAEAAHQVTPLQAAMDHLSETFHKTDAEGRSLASAIGDAVAAAAAKAVGLLDKLIGKLEEVREAANRSGADQPGIAGFTADEAARFRNASERRRDPAGAAAVQAAQANYAAWLQDPAAVLSAVSSRGAIGAGQLMPATAASLGVNPFIPSQNIQGTLAYIQQLSRQFSDPQQIAGAYNMGPTGYQNAPGAARGYQNLVFKADQSKLPKDIAGMVDYWAGVLELPADLVALGKKILLVENQGKQGPVIPGAPALGPTSSAAAVQAAASSVAGPSADAQQQALAKQGAQVTGLLPNQETIDKILDEMGKVQAAKDLLGKTPSVLTAAETELLAKYNLELLKLGVNLTNAEHPTRLATQAELDRAQALGIINGAERKTLEVRQEIARQREQNPDAPISEVDAAEKLAAAQATLTAAYTAKGAELAKQIDQEKQAAVAAAGGAEGARQAAAATQAFNDVNASFAKDDPAFSEALIRRKQQYLELGSAAANAAAQKDIFSTSHQIEMLNVEIATLGQDADARAVLIQRLQTEFQVRQTYAGAGQGFVQTLIDEKNKVADLNQIYQKHQDALNYLSGQVQSAFQSIGDAMAETFVSGGKKAVDWGNILQGVLKKVIAELLQLAIFNPIINDLFGGSNGKSLPTLGGIIGGLFGGGGSGAQQATQTNSNAALLSAVVAAGGAGNTIGQGSANVQFLDPGNPALGFTTAGGGGSLGGNLTTGGSLGSGGDLLSVLSALRGGQQVASGGGGLLGTASNLFSIAGTAQKLGLFGSTSSSGGGILDFFGLGNVGKQFSGLTDSIGLTGKGGLISNISGIFNTPIASSFGGSVFGGLPSFSQLGVSAGEQAFLGAAGIEGPSAGGLAAAGGAVSTIGDLIGGVGAGFAAGSLVGGLVQRGANKVGPGPQIGAGVGAVGGAIAGTLIFPGIGTIIGALIGGILGGSGGGLIGPRPPSPYSQTLIGLKAGGAGLEKGITNSQLVDGAGESAQAAKDIKQINTALTAANASFDLSGPLLSASGDFGGARSRDTINSFVGANNKDPQAQKTLKSWGLDPTDIAWLQVGQNSPKGSQDPSKIQDLNTDFWKFAFKSAEPLMNSFFQGTGGFDPVRGSARGFTSIDEFQNQTKVVTAFITAIKDTDFASRVPDLFRTKLPQGGTAQDYQATLTPIVTFVTQTVPALLKIGSPLGSLQDTVNGLTDQFKDAIKTAGDLGYKEQELTAARDGAIASAQAAAAQTLRRTDEGLHQRVDAANVALNPNDQNLARAAGLQALDNRAQAEREDFAKSLVDTYGKAYAATQGYAEQIALEETALQKERLVGIKALDDAAQQQTKSAQAAATSFTTSLKAFVKGLETGSASPASPASQLQFAQSDFAETANKAGRGDATAMAGLQGSATTLLNVAKAFYGSSSGYTAIFNEVVAGLKGVAVQSNDQLTAAFFAAQTKDQTTQLDEAIKGLRDEIVTLENITSGTSADPVALAQIAAANAAAINSVAAQTATAALATAGSVADIVLQQKAMTNTQAYTNVLLVQYLSWGFGVVNQAIVNHQNSMWAQIQWLAANTNQLQSWDDSLIIQAINSRPGLAAGGAVGGWDSSWNVGGGGGSDGDGEDGGAMAKGGEVANGVFGRDSVAAKLRDGSHIMLAGGEFVVTAAQAKKHAHLLAAINAGDDAAAAGARRPATAAAGHGHAAVTHVPVLRAPGPHAPVQAAAQAVKHLAAGGWTDAAGWTGANDDAPASRVAAVRPIDPGVRVEAAIRYQTISLLEELRMLRAEVAALRGEARQRGDRPDRLAS